MNSTTSLSLRKANITDIPVILQLVQWAFRGGKPSQKQWTGEEHLVAGPRTTPEQLRDLIERDGSVIIVCERVETDGKRTLVGSIHTEKQGSDGHIAMLAVDPDEQASGVGRKLMQAAEEEARTVFGCKRMLGHVISQRPELMDWYHRLGYRETGETEPFSSPGVTTLVEGLHFVLIEKPL